MVPLIIGRLPEPGNIGGVSIFVSRLLSNSSYLLSNPYVFFSTKYRNIFRLIPLIYRSSFVHFNGSNPYAMFYVALICFILRKKLILSVHAEVGISGKILNVLEQLAIRLAFQPIVGVGSIDKSLRCNKRSVVISSFIAPKIDVDSVVFDLVSSITNKTIFCTNANSFAFDNNDQEIYGITFLVDYFSNKNDSILIIADTSGQYSNHFVETRPPNVVFLNSDIDFSYLLTKSDCFIRFTSTDGDSLSVMESLYLNIPVIATDCIERNESCILCRYGSMESLDHAIKKFRNKDYSITDVFSSERSYDKLYEGLSL